MNKFFSLCLVSSLFFTGILTANSSPPLSFLMSRCAPALQKPLQAILTIPEARDLIAAIQREGSISIIATHAALAEEFGAYWDPDERIIYVGISKNQTQGDLIGSILFELHNAFVNRKFMHLNDLASRRMITKRKYIESMEYLEYINALNASKMAEKGIQMGVFPTDAFLSTYSNFQEHLEFQKMSGHSDCFGHNYDLCIEFRL